MTENFQEHFCYNCNYRLFRFIGEGEVEIICPKCRRIVYSKRYIQGIGPRGKEFYERGLQIRCKTCKHVLCHIMGELAVVIYCVRCKQDMNYDTKDIREQLKRTHRPLNMLQHGY